MAVIEKEKTLAPVKDERLLGRLEPFFTDWPMRTPFGLIDRVREEMDRIFEGFGVPRTPATFERAWMPRVEMFDRKGELVIRVDLPGLKKEDISLQITEDTLVLEGERKVEEKEEKEGYYRTECEYGRFHRSIPLPEGAIYDKATAVFKDGVLEIVVPAPKLQALTPKKLEIK